ncbi:MAG: tRNA preQ1(34) S-adenosylmethionine ribosyltransferase-isomerase QueA [Gemmatimonadota bacterium]
MPTAAFDYPFPAGLVARHPPARRGDSRLMVVDRRSGELTDRTFESLAELFPPRDLLVVNDSRVFPARLRGRKPTGARAELLLLRPVGGSAAPAASGGGAGLGGSGRDAGSDDASPRTWEALVRPGGKLKPGRRVGVADGFEVLILESLPGGRRLVRLEGDRDPWTLIRRHGQVPLPPYLGREAEAADRERYQTVYARRRGSVAAPTAGLHFTRELLDRLRQREVEIVPLTLHVGVGTFRPVQAARPSEHRLHPERYRVEPAAAEAVNAARRRGARVWAVGTTVVRVLETLAGEDGTVRPGSGWTELFIHPPYEFRIVDRLLTNFHLPRSSLLMLVCAFGGRELILRAYGRAVRDRYRFYSYGDAMLVR